MCCQYTQISEIVGRYLHPCCTCYCCTGGNPLEEDNYYIYLQSKTCVQIISKSYNQEDDCSDNEYYYKKNKRNKRNKRNINFRKKNKYNRNK